MFHPDGKIYVSTLIMFIIYNIKYPLETKKNLQTFRNDPHFVGYYASDKDAFQVDYGCF